MRKISQNTIGFIACSLLLFITASTWLINLNEVRIGVYICTLTIALLVSDFIFNSNNKWVLIVEIPALTLSIYFVLIEILRILTTAGIQIV